MIWSLTREQLRSQKRFTIAAAIVIAITVGLAAYGSFMAITVAKSALTVTHSTGSDREVVASVNVPSDTTFEAVTASVDAANAEGYDAVANTDLTLTLPNANPNTWDFVTALHGEVDWDALLADGTPPQAGEIVLSAQWAADNGYAVGDSLQLVATPYEQAPVIAGEPLTISGLSRSAVETAGVHLPMPSAYVAWADVPELVALASEAYSHPDADPAAMDQTVTIGGNGNWLWDEAWAASPGWDQNYYGVASAKFLGVLTGVGVGALVVGIIAMAFALGRAQAHARSRWVATARALGVTKRQIALSTALEATVIGLAAGLAGFVLGGIATAIQVGLIHASTASPMLVGAASLVAPVFIGALALGVVLSLIVSAVPAFWATRVEPTAALKPITDLSQAEASRRVSARPLTIAWLTSSALLTLAAIGGAGGAFLAVVALAAIIFVIGGFMLAHEVLRRSLPWHAKRLTRSRRRAVMVAGDAMAARPRQFTIPAFITALATAALIGIVGPQLAGDATNDYLNGMSPERDMVYRHLSVEITLAVFALVMVLCVAIGASTATLTVGEAATREALGLSRAEGRAATALQYLVAQAHGGALGLAVGMVATAYAMPYVINGPQLHVTYWLVPVTVLIAVTVGVGTLCALAGAALVSAFAPATAPLATAEARA